MHLHVWLLVSSHVYCMLSRMCSLVCAFVDFAVLYCLEYGSFISSLGYQGQKQQRYSWYLLLKRILPFCHFLPPLPPPVWCWSWNSNTLATWWEELTHWKRSWCWERLKVEGEGDNRGWDAWMASSTQRTWVWVNSGSWWWTQKPAVLSPWNRKESDTTEWLNWTKDT